jgi:serine/threonine protein kinase
MVEKYDRTMYKGLDKYITGKNKTTLKVGEITFIIDKNYKITNKLGKGAYGQVVAAEDLSEKDPDMKLCAIKKIEEIFEHATYAKRCLRELKILRLLEHENVIYILII